LPNLNRAKAKEETQGGRHPSGAQCHAGHHPGGGKVHPQAAATEKTASLSFVQWCLPSRQLLALAELLQTFVLFIKPVRFPRWARSCIAFGIRRVAGLLNLWADFTPFFDLVCVD
jgi:hypothetical protein